MTDGELMGLLLANRRLEIEELRQWLERERKDCIPVLRVYEIAQNPDAATESETTQMASCAHCARAVALMRADLARSAEDGGIARSSPAGLVPGTEPTASDGVTTGQPGG